VPEYLSAAVEVLRSSDRPLTASEITTEALRRGLIRPMGKTPRNTMSATLGRAVKDMPDCPIQRFVDSNLGQATTGQSRWMLKNS
jgi:hypothetical protein